MEFGPLRLLPYERGRAPGDLPNVTQADMDTILNAYAVRPGTKVRRATLVELGEWHAGMEAGELVSLLFPAQRLLAFSALSHRHLFRRQSDYCNFDSYALTIQRFQAGQADTFAFTTRRRDGGARHIWGSDQFAFYCPHHVEAGARVALDRPLLNALFATELFPSLAEAIKEFNSANTDSPTVPEHVEVVMVKSAFEWLFGINENAGAFRQALLSTVADGGDATLPKGPLEQRWLEARRPPSGRLLEAWATEFCDLRGASAHGRRREQPHHVLSRHAHLAFAAMLFPLVFKRIAANNGWLALDRYDSARLRLLDHYLSYDPLDFDEDAEDPTHPWQAIDSHARTLAAVHLYFQD